MLLFPQFTPFFSISYYPKYSTMLQPLLGFFYSEPGNGLWKRKADAAFQYCTVC